MNTVAIPEDDDDDHLSVTFGSSWTPPDERKQDQEFRALNLIEQLRHMAAGRRASARQYKGVTWVGTFPPGYYDRREADILERAADQLEADMNARSDPEHKRGG